MTEDETRTLEPGLSKFDREVLALVPACRGREYPLSRTPFDTATLWQIAEGLDSTDLTGPAGVLAELNGLEQLGYVRSAASASRRRTVYWRTPKGDDAIASDEKAEKMEERRAWLTLRLLYEFASEGWQYPLADDEETHRQIEAWLARRGLSS